MTTKTVRPAGSYLRVIEHHLGSDEPELEHLTSINHAVSVLENARAWEWTQNNTTTLTPVVGQGYIELPVDVRDVVGLHRPSSLSQVFVAASLGEITHARASSPSVHSLLWHHAREVYGAATRTFRPRLEIYPTPTTADPLTLVYHARIPRVGADDDLIVLPDWLDGVFEELCVGIAHGREEPELGSVSARVAAVLDGAAFRVATERDGMLHDMGAPWSGGAVQIQRARQSMYPFGRTWRLNN